MCVYINRHDSKLPRVQNAPHACDKLCGHRATANCFALEILTFECWSCWDVDLVEIMKTEKS